MMSGWGLKFFDYDNDGNLDLLLCNGHPDDKVDKKISGVSYREPMLLFKNDGKNFQNVSAKSGAIFSRPLAGRGLALGDFDNDGSIDLLITQNNSAPILLRNNAGRKNHWLGIKLVGRKANIDAIGARVTYRAGELERHQFKVGGGSYLSSHDPRMVLGLGQQTKLDWLEVKWPQPSGKTERFTNLPIDRYITIVEGEGKWK
jgi:enediyne biosynthesis protein E4